MTVAIASPPTGWPTDPEAPVLLLSFAATPTERAIVDRWLAQVGPAARGVERVWADELEREEALTHDAATQVVPAGVAWVAPQQRSDGFGVHRLVAAVNRRRPLARAQPRLLRSAPESARVVVGAPASLAELRRRHERDTAGTASFAGFVRRQAVLALERAGRAADDGLYKLPRMIPEEVQASRSFGTGVHGLAEALGEPEDVVAGRAAADLEEMAAAHSRLAIDLFARFGRYLLRAYVQDVDAQRLDALRELNRSHSLVFLPNHRSYLDPFVMRSVLLSHGFPANHCFAGNNMSWWPMGEWTRRTGNIILRRSIGEDPVYKFVLREYLGYIVRKRLNLEWYIEGGRTRTGKLRPPRYGLMTYLIDAFDQLDEHRDLYLVPVSIVYDGLPEVWSLTEELRGASKQAESVSWMLHYPRSTGGGFGKVHVSLGEPLSLRQALAEQPADARRQRVERVAFEVCHRINTATPVTPTALLTFALLGVNDRALSFAEIRTVMAPLMAYFTRRGLEVTGDLGDTGELRQSLDWLVETKVVTRYDGGLDPVWAISQDRHLEAAFYRNSVVHLILERSILELILSAAAEERAPMTGDGWWGEALRLRELLKFEFFFPSKREFRTRLSDEAALIDPEWRERLSDPEGVRTVLAAAHPLLAHRALSSYLEAYHVMAHRLVAHPRDAAIDDERFVEECLGVARQERMQHRLQTADSMTVEVFKTGLRLAAYRDLVGPGGEDLADRRRAFAAEVDQQLERLRRMRALSPTAEDAGSRP